MLTTKIKFAYEPDYAVPPGETLKETIDSLGMSQKELAIRTGLTEKHISHIITGHSPITYETADKLELVTGVPARVWNNLEMNYRERLEKIEATRRLKNDLDWLRRIPINELIKRKKIEAQQREDKLTLLRSILSFFGVSSVSSWESLWLKPAASWRHSKCFKSKPETTATWLRLGEIEAQKVQCEPFSKTKFEKALSEIRQLTVEDPKNFASRLIELSAAAGVAVVFVPEIKGCAASAVTRWVSPDKAIIQLNLRHKTNDHLWFSFFHEAGHVLNDSKKEIFFAEPSNQNDEHEQKANAFASDFLIPSQRANELLGLKNVSDVKQFASSLGIHPGIVVGRLQHDKIIDFSAMNFLKTKFMWSESEGV
jgi:HTH-type transcriptional regulator/antitoxin HigA